MATPELGSSTSWSTDAELQFLSGLGGWYNGQRLTRVELLRGYLEAAKCRFNWGPINAATAVDFAQSELKKAIADEAGAVQGA